MEVALSLSQGKRLTSVVVPAIVASDKGVSEILSRMPSLSAALANTDQALAFYSRNDPQSRPLYGTRAPASQLLLRVNKRSGTVSVEGLVMMIVFVCFGLLRFFFSFLFLFFV